MSAGNLILGQATQGTQDIEPMLAQHKPSLTQRLLFAENTLKLCQIKQRWKDTVKTQPRHMFTCIFIWYRWTAIYQFEHTANTQFMTLYSLSIYTIFRYGLHYSTLIHVVYQ